MRLGLIDMGSNSVRLSVYELDCSAGSQAGHTLLYSTKIKAGLAGYVDDRGYLSDEGIMRACDALAWLGIELSGYRVDEEHVFATASLRNIRNSQEVLDEIFRRTRFRVEVLSEEREATLGFEALSYGRQLGKGVSIDVGGGSSEIVVFSDGRPRLITSLPVGSLNTHSRFVEGTIPSPQEALRIVEYVRDGYRDARWVDCTGEQGRVDGTQGRTTEVREETLYAVGGTARAFAKLTIDRLGVGSYGNRFETAQLDDLVAEMMGDAPKAEETILQSCPDRLLTFVPGLLILQTAANIVGAKQLAVCAASVREGYVLQRYRQRA